MTRLVLILLLGLVACSQKGMTYTADFPTARGLLKYTKVVLAGVDVGTVTRVQPVPGTAIDDPIQHQGHRTRVTVELQPGLVLREGTVLTLQNRSAIGETILKITPGAMDANALPDGGHIEKTRLAIRIEDLGEVLGPILQRLDLERMQEVFGFLTSWMEAREDDVPLQVRIDQIRTILRITTTLLEANQQNINSLVDTISRLSTKLEPNQVQQIQALYTDWTHAYETSTRVQKKLQTLLDQWNEAVPVGQLDAMYAQGKELMLALEAVQLELWLKIAKEIIQKEGATGGVVPRTPMQIQADMEGYVPASSQPVTQ